MENLRRGNPSFGDAVRGCLIGFWLTPYPTGSVPGWLWLGLVVIPFQVFIIDRVCGPVGVDGEETHGDGA